MKNLFLSLLGTHVQENKVASFDSSSAEIIAYHRRSNSVYATNSYATQIDIISLEDPAKPTLVGFVPLSQPVTSISIHKNVLAVALVDAGSKQLLGNVAFYDIKNSHTLLVSLEAGALPDAVFFSPNGRKVVVCNEGEPDDVWDGLNLGQDHNPEGTVTVVNIDGKHIKNLTQADVVQLDFNAFDRNTLRAAGVKITGPGSNDGSTTLSQYLEPEYAAISSDSSTAYVSLQENNAVAVVDLSVPYVVDVLALGLVDRSLAKNALDASNTNPVVDIRPWHDLVGLYQPDTIAVYEDDYVRYLATANEGDAQDYANYSEEARVKDLPLDPVVFPDAATLQLDNNLGRLKVTTALGKNTSQLYEKIYSYGGRSFSLFKVVAGSPLELVFDSGSQFEKITSVALPNGFNASNDANSFKNRSDDKGPEPEALLVFKYVGVRYALVGLERVGGMMLYNISDLENVYFVQYLNNRNFNVVLSDPPTELELDVVKDLGPESLLYVDDRKDSVIVAANEVSGSVSTYDMRRVHAAKVCRNRTVVDHLDVKFTLDEVHPNVQWVHEHDGEFDLLAGETGQSYEVHNVDPADTSVYFALLTTYCDDVTNCVSSERLSVNY